MNRYRFRRLVRKSGLDVKVLRGELTSCIEWGGPLIPYGIQLDGQRGYEGLEGICSGDHLTVFNPGQSGQKKTVRWEGVVRINRRTNRPRLRNIDLPTWTGFFGSALGTTETSSESNSSTPKKEPLRAIVLRPTPGPE